MPLKLYPRPNGIWHIRGTVQGRRFDQSAKTRVRSEAEQIRAKWEREAFQEAVYGKRAVGSFLEAMEGYLKAGGDPRFLDPLLEAFGGRKLSDIGQREVDDLAAKRDVKPSTRVREIYTPLLAVLNFGAETGLCDRPNIRKPKVGQGRTEYLRPAEAEAWITALPPHLSRLVIFLLSTGCRITEALELEWKDVSPEGQRVTLWETKAGYARSFGLGRRARQALPERPESGKGVIFRNSRGEPWHGYDAINLMLRRQLSRNPGELTPAHCHLFRHTWATWAYACTRDLTFVMQQGGWRSLAMLGRYTHAASPDLATAVISQGWEFDGRELAGLKKKPRRNNKMPP